MSIPERIRRGRQRGLTMVELVITIVIIGVGVAGILQVMTLASRYSADPQQRKQALAIAEGLMEEIRLARFTYCDPSDPLAETAANAAACSIPERVGQAGPEPAATRPFDNVNDYVASFDTPLNYTADAAGNAFAGAVGSYQASVTISPDAGLGPAGARIASGPSPAEMNALRIRVTVSYNDGHDSVVLDGYRTRYAGNAVP